MIRSVEQKYIYYNPKVLTFVASWTLAAVSWDGNVLSLRRVTTFDAHSAVRWYVQIHVT